MYNIFNRFIVFVVFVSVVLLDGMEVKQKEDSVQERYVPNDSISIEGAVRPRMSAGECRDRLNKTAVDGLLLGLGNEGDIDLEVLDLFSGVVTHYAYPKDESLRPIEDLLYQRRSGTNEIHKISAFCLLSKAMPIVTCGENVCHYQASRQIGVSEKGVKTYALDLKKRLDCFLENGSEKIIKLQRMQSRLVAVSSQGSVVTWPIDGEDIIDTKTVHGRTSDSNTVFSIAIDEHKELVFLGLKRGRVALYDFGAGLIDIKPKIIQVFAGINKQVTMIDSYAGSVIFGAFCNCQKKGKDVVTSKDVYRCCKQHKLATHGACDNCRKQYQCGQEHQRHEFTGTEKKMREYLEKIKENKEKEYLNFAERLCSHAQETIENEKIEDQCNCYGSDCKNVVVLSDSELLRNFEATKNLKTEIIDLDANIGQKLKQCVRWGMPPQPRSWVEDVNTTFMVFDCFVLPGGKLFCGGIITTPKYHEPSSFRKGVHWGMKKAKTTHSHACVISLVDLCIGSQKIDVSYQWSTLESPSYVVRTNAFIYHISNLPPFSGPDYGKFIGVQPYALEAVKPIQHESVEVMKISWNIIPYISTLLYCGITVVAIAGLYKTLSIKAQ